jgi:hypothetical protein
MPSRQPITIHAAYLLSAKLRARGVLVAGRDILHWPSRAITAARQWLEGLDSGEHALSWPEFVGEDLPLASPISWPGSSTQGQGSDV